MIRVTVRPDLSAGSINGSKSICYNTSAGTLGNSSSASGGNGSYTYQWQRRSPGGSWANISGETSTSLSPGNLNDDTEFRRRVYSCGQYKYSNVVTVNVFNQVSTPTTSSYGRCGPGVINLNPSVGSGGNTIRWYNNSSGGSHFTQTLEYAPDLSADQTYYISSYSTLTGCESSRVAINAVINPEPNVDAGSTLTYYEFENSVNLSGTGESPQGGNYSGSYVNNDYFDLSQSGTGSYTVFYNYINTEGCPGTDSKTIIVEDNPDITVNGNNEIVWGESRTLSVPAGFASYQWYRNDQAISGATSNIYEAGSVGEYKVNITADNNNSMMVSPKNIINNASLQNENFVQTINYKVKASERQGMREIGEVNEQIVYFDGLGRKFQTVMTQASPNKMDLVAPIEYDELGRPSKEFLPYVPQKNDGLVDHAALRGSGDEYVQSSQYSFYAGGSSDEVANTSVPYAETVYENSPLNRPVAQYAPGEDWGKEDGANPVTTAYEINSDSDQVIRFEVDGNALQVDGEYGNGLFQKTIVTDENSNQSVTFTDAFDKTILKRNIANGENFDTYYVYDFYDNLRFVIPPEAAHRLTVTSGQFPSDLLDQFVFQYQYDNRDRMEWKKVPGAEPVVMIYDDRERLVLTQDGEQAKSNLFSFTKYDALNRPIMTGEKEINNSIPNLRDLLNGNDWLQNYDAYETLEGSKYGYTSNSLPKNLDLDEIHTVTYYDNYDFRSEISLNGAEYDYSVSGTENAYEQTDFVKGQVTGSLTRVLGTNEMLASVNYYDERNRLIKNVSEQNGDNLISSSNVYDFVGNLLKTDMTYQLHDKKIKISESFTYDHADRLLEQYHSLSETVKWQNVTGYSIDENFDLTHNGSAGYHNTSAHTAKAIGSDQVGFIEHRPEMFSRMLFGLNDDAAGTGYTDMEYCLYVAANGSLVVYENGSNKGGLGSYQIGDVLQVAKTKDEIHYIKNGEVLRSRPLEHEDVAFYGDVTSYNVGDRITDVYFSTSGKQLLLSNQYNELGELVNKNLHEDGDNFAQSVDYRYNIRGWLTRINNADLRADNVNEKTDLFGMELGYTDSLGTSADPQLNGNIAAVKWGGKRNDLEAENVLQQNSYGYGYDGLNRITEADFYENASQNPGQKYQLRINEYDRNGNIKQLQRKDATANLMDDLTYDYDGTGNQLNFVSDAVTDSAGFIDGNKTGNDYAYDDNGNMILDANKAITSISYNNLNLPEEVSFENGNKIVYIYDASGVKLRQEVYKNDTLRKATDYIGSLILENDTLQFIQTAEGRVVPKTVDGVDKNEYQYHLKDHLGNVRSTFAVRDVDYAADFEKVMVDGLLKHYNPYFNNYDSIDILSNPLKRSGNYAHRLTGGGTDIVGLMKSLYVSKGDKVSAEVYGKYLDAQFTNDEINGAALVNALVTMLGGGTLTGEGTIIENNLNSDFISAAMADGSEEESPKAYLNYIMLDKNFNYVNSGFERLSESAADPGDGSGTHQKLSFEEIQIEEDGYLMVFLSNESHQAVEVFWDDFRVDHHYNAVLQADDYYPGGLTFNSYQRSFSKANNYKYQGKEEVPEMGVGIYDFHARMYDATLGRTFQMDPHLENYYPWSPYSWTGNNPVINVDPTGEDWFTSNLNGVMINIKGQSEFDYNNLREEFGEGIAQFIYNLGGDAGSDSWENFGDDDMFDTDDNKISENLGGLTMMTEEFSESFMNEHGYQKALDQEVTELDYTLYEQDASGWSKDKGGNKEILSSKVTYAKPEDFGQTKPLTKSYRSFMIRMERSYYNQVIPHHDIYGKGKNIFSKEVPDFKRAGLELYQGQIVPWMLRLINKKK
ncbi:DUF6443 domain-containing protein [Marivirga sp.]|uniref:DUF6443 domain-containing protein n=1 Tax=Marivirga sp. TaxID=2018662 RepID=UPI003DA6F60C